MDEDITASWISEDEYREMMRERQMNTSEPRLMKEFHRQKYQRECQRNWDIFYKRNGDRFFKDRHWTSREFPCLANLADANESKLLLELGCGVGNFIYPLAAKQMNAKHRFLGCDLSPRAVALAREHPDFDETRIFFWHHDIAASRFFITDREDCIISETARNRVFHDQLDENGQISLQADIISCIFVLSALPADKLPDAVENIAAALKPGGTLILRDYAKGDHAELRFQQASSANQVDHDIYVRQDGTLSHFFDLSELNGLFARFGLVMKNGGGYVKTITRNRKQGLHVERLFVQAEYTKSI